MKFDLSLEVKLKEGELSYEISWEICNGTICVLIISIAKYGARGLPGSNTIKKFCC